MDHVVIGDVKGQFPFHWSLPRGLETLDLGLRCGFEVIKDSDSPDDITTLLPGRVFCQAVAAVKREVPAAVATFKACRKMTFSNLSGAKRSSEWQGPLTRTRYIKSLITARRDVCVFSSRDLGKPRDDVYISKPVARSA